jgi:hypothetical protein
MKKLIYGIIISLLILACSSKKEDYLIKFYNGEFDEIGVPSGYLNSKGDTIIPIGKYYYCYTDTIRDFGMVIENGTGKILGIDQNNTELFEVFKSDNGPDYVSDGLFRIIKNEKIGYADENGIVVIKPKYKCASSFVLGKAQVTDSCSVNLSSGKTMFLSNAWYDIDKNGERVKK